MFEFCGDNWPDTPWSDWQNKAASIKVGPNTKAYLCDNPIWWETRSGLCRNYFADDPYIGEVLNNKVSHVQVSTFDPFDFTMVIMSDPQFGFCESEHCLQNTKAGTKYCWEGNQRIKPGCRWVSFSSLTRSSEINANQRNSIVTLKNTYEPKHFAGVIVNGDLTHGMFREEIAAYIAMYEDSGLNLYPGLGNHDYYNHLTKWCDGYFMWGGSYRAWAESFCAIRLLHWFVSRIDSIPTVERDYANTERRDFLGSLAYSFDVGNWHFVQLNNHPGYTTAVSAYDTYSGLTRTYDIEQSFDWLKQDLDASLDKKVVINLHVWPDKGPDKGSDASSNEDHQWTWGWGVTRAHHNRLVKLLSQYPNVEAVFAGHWHAREGYTTTTRLEPAAEEENFTPADIPVYHSGSSEENRYLKVRFTPESLEVTPIDASNGGIKPVESDSHTAEFGIANLDAAVECIGKFVEMKRCTLDRFEIIQRFCRVEEYPPINDDDFLKLSIGVGKCVETKWDDLKVLLKDKDARDTGGIDGGRPPIF